MSRGSSFSRFLGLLGARNFWFGMRHKIAWFYHVLSVLWCCHSVCGECHGVSNDVLNDVFLQLSLRAARCEVSGSLFKKAQPTASLSIAAQPKRGRHLLGAEASGRHSLHGETLLCGSHHVVRRLENTCDLRKMWLVVYGYVIKSVMCVSVRF